ncbi:hypothetical protein Hypma_011970 [Hypsizygus marmoreus]|uniref:MYND-type domain-containing protein n=1 Tax=Hypsizygus marmoreus TaxID=39966 RepID=A0A369JI30_HYPMA|nr:hypothetical protein Hypma_011970 [Hypsizygus marmoreus]
MEVSSADQVARIKEEFIQGCLQKVVVDPKRFIKAAASGSQDDLKIFACSWFYIPDIFSMSPLDAFTPHFMVPPTSDDELLMNVAHALVGLTYAKDFLGTHEELVKPLADAWPGLFKWLVFLHDLILATSPPSKVLYGDELFRSMILTSVCGPMYCFCHHTRLSELVLSTPGSVELAARLWLHDEFDPPRPSVTSQHVGGTAVLATFFEISRSPRALVQRIVKMKDFDRVKLATLALHRASSAATVWYNEEGGGNVVTNLLETINHLTSVPELLHTFLNAHSVLIITLTLRYLCNRQLESGDEELGHPTLLCLGYIAKHLDSGNGIAPVCEAVKSGLLWAFGECSQYFDQPMPSGVSAPQILKIVTQILPRYLTSRLVVQTVDDSMKEMPISPKILDTTLKEAWNRFLELLSERKDLMEKSQLHGVGCANDLCTMPATPEVKLMKCSRCSSLSYCSKECQVVDWKNGHKANCKVMATERRAGIAKVVYGHAARRRDRAFHLALSKYDATRQRDFLRDQASQKYPDSSLTDLVIVINYLIVPPTFSVKHIDEYEKSAATRPSGDDNNAHDIEEFREKRQYLLIESTFPGGNSVKVVTVKLDKDFWESS